MSKARELADLGSVTTRLDEVGNTDGALSNRNLIINGAMQVAQRGTSSSNLGLKYLVADRFWTYAGGSGTIEQSTDAPDGFNYSLYWNRTSGGSMGTSVELTRQGHNPYGMLTFSMYVKGDFSSTALYFNFRNYSGGGADSVPIVTHTGFGNYATWTRVVLSVDCTGIAAHANNKMLNIEFGGFPVGAKITGVQLEVGDTATPFEHRSYGDELARCQRYYSVIGGGSYVGIDVGQQFSTTGSIHGIQYPAPMRAAPSISFDNLIATDRTVFDETVTGFSVVTAGDKSAYIRTVWSTTRGSVGDAVLLAIRNGYAGGIKFDAEL